MWAGGLRGEARKSRRPYIPSSPESCHHPPVFLTTIIATTIANTLLTTNRTACTDPPAGTNQTTKMIHDVQTEPPRVTGYENGASAGAPLFTMGGEQVHVWDWSVFKCV